MSASKPPSRRPGRVRIVAGKWRRRLIAVADRDGLRPTPDRVRETVFSWLQPWLPGARVLDLYAGTGILGLEALSRGAAEVTFVERDPLLVRRLRENLETLGGADEARVVAGDARRFLSGPARPVDVAFVDPPYARAAHGELCTLLADGLWLADGALVYLEQHAGDADPALPPGFTITKSGRAGQVRYLLARYAAGPRERQGDTD